MPAKKKAKKRTAKTPKVLEVFNRACSNMMEAMDIAVSAGHKPGALMSRVFKMLEVRK